MKIIFDFYCQASHSYWFTFLECTGMHVLHFDADQLASYRKRLLRNYSERKHGEYFSQAVWVA